MSSNLAKSTGIWEKPFLPGSQNQSCKDWGLRGDVKDHLSQCSMYQVIKPTPRTWPAMASSWLRPEAKAPGSPPSHGPQIKARRIRHKKRKRISSFFSSQETDFTNGNKRMINKLGVLNAFSTYSIFNLQCISQDVIPLFVKEDLWII